VDLGTVARRLSMSDRGLQRGLECERTTFRAVWDGVRREAAEALMANPSLSVKTIAFNAGFGDVAASSNAFKRWVGCTPTSYRERLATPAQRGHPKAKDARSRT
jgi:AraC-like DNA-binding protein